MLEGCGYYIITLLTVADKEHAPVCDHIRDHASGGEMDVEQLQIIATSAEAGKMETIFFYAQLINLQRNLTKLSSLVCEELSSTLPD